MHKRVHTGYRPFQCKECGKTFALSQGLKNHEKRHVLSEGPVEKTHQCIECGKFFKERLYLRRHQKLHLAEEAKKLHLVETGVEMEAELRKLFPCDAEDCTCGKVFVSVASLRRHRLIVSGEKNYFCDVCGRGFTTPDYLRKHGKVHDEVHLRRYECDQCEKHFSNKQHLDRHKPKHAKDRPSYNCAVCQKSFLTEYYVTKHSMKQHGVA